MSHSVTRQLRRIITGTQVAEGAGVQLTRYIGGTDLNMLDPFLLFDVFQSDQAQDYIAGFPPHPHRGFETVTYMQAGQMRHQDSAGHSGVIQAGDVQWMTAASGIIHSEMPEQQAGLLAGCQLWINLPSAHKMIPPQYQEFAHSTIPVEQHNDGQVKVIAGTSDAGLDGAIQHPYVQPYYIDITLSADASFQQALPLQHAAFLYLIKGDITVGEEQTRLMAGQLGLLSQGNQVKIHAASDSQCLLIAARPIHEPVVKGGPFVMTTRQEIEHAFADYHAGRFA